MGKDGAVQERIMVVVWETVNKRKILVADSALAATLTSVKAMFINKNKTPVKLLFKSFWLHTTLSTWIRWSKLKLESGMFSWRTTYRIGLRNKSTPTNLRLLNFKRLSKVFLSDCAFKNKSEEKVKNFLIASTSASLMQRHTRTGARNASSGRPICGRTKLANAVP